MQQKGCKTYGKWRARAHRPFDLETRSQLVDSRLISHALTLFNDLHGFVVDERRGDPMQAGRAVDFVSGESNEFVRTITVIQHYFAVFTIICRGWRYRTEFVANR